MGFTAGLIFGFAFGVVIVARLAFVMQRRRKQRIAKAAELQFLGQLTQDDIKKLCDGNSPLGISLPEFERVQWMNKLLDKVWPNVAKLFVFWMFLVILPFGLLSFLVGMCFEIAAGAVIKESLEPILESYRPIGISQLKFKKLFLGNVAPQIEGIRMQSLKEGQVTMDLDFRWRGDSSIVLDVYTRCVLGLVLPVELKDFKLFATIRVIFVLSEEMPFISAIVVALLAKPKREIRYTLKAIGVPLTAVPGVTMVGKGVKALPRGMTNSIGNISKKTRDANGTAK
ncbi:hypothetical protein AXG93_4831s1050 [Marchantia polymorpha subsp. ruderalis]|uniref:SMP-LTD domain-containing protein n=1 Tax=Marchantia polymorpha subsp. ruderalis TaxID=1480154 RepID=A0A176WB67_MARPO|nr:hypothetical protein AXG93_4831s1050 [Marchantia polymorpha subsp. ruderalis]